jgi:hypothetical protein
VTDWQEIVDSGFELPPGADLAPLTAELSAALADPDPDLRDGAACAVAENHGGKKAAEHTTAAG